MKATLDERFKGKYGQMLEEVLQLIEPKFDQMFNRGQQEFASAQELDAGFRKMSDQLQDRIEKTTKTMVNELLAMMEPKIEKALSNTSYSENATAASLQGDSLTMQTLVQQVTKNKRDYEE